MSEIVQYEYLESGYSVIRLNRPDKKNTISPEMIVEFKKSLQIAKQEPIKFLVITGAGDGMFCAGGDLNHYHGELAADEAFSRLYPMKEILYELVSFPVPTICMLNGSALGGGCEIASACDFRIAKEGAAFGFVQTKSGILPGWGGGTLLYEKVHPNFAFQWITEADILDVQTLKEQGWIHHIIPGENWNNHEMVLQAYVNKSQDQMRYLKSQFLKKISVLALSAEMNEEVRQCAKLWESDAHQQEVQQFFGG